MDAILDSSCNFLATRPRLTCALLIALILVAGQMDTVMP
jgi:hypothetical protein